RVRKEPVDERRVAESPPLRLRPRGELGTLPAHDEPTPMSTAELREHRHRLQLTAERVTMEREDVVGLHERLEAELPVEGPRLLPLADEPVGGEIVARDLGAVAAEHPARLGRHGGRRADDDHTGGLVARELDQARASRETVERTPCERPRDELAGEVVRPAVV